MYLQSALNMLSLIVSLLFCSDSEVTQTCSQRVVGWSPCLRQQPIFHNVRSSQSALPDRKGSVEQHQPFLLFTHVHAPSLPLLTAQQTTLPSLWITPISCNSGYKRQLTHNLLRDHKIYQNPPTHPPAVSLALRCCKPD